MNENDPNRRSNRLDFLRFRPAFHPGAGVGIALRLLGEAGVLQENFGQAIITAAFVDDILSLVPWMWKHGSCRETPRRKIDDMLGKDAFF